MTFINTPNAPVPGGHYSQAVVHNGQVYLSGILPITPSGEKLTSATIAEQTEQILANLDAILLAAGSQRDKVLKVTVFISDIIAWGYCQPDLCPVLRRPSAGPFCRALLTTSLRLWY